MIRSFRHAGLEKFFHTGCKAGVRPAHARKLSIQLGTLNVVKNPMQMNVPGWDLHPLKGNLVGHLSIKVNANWRMTYTFDGEDAILVDYQDYHGK
jgi:proteic killer suppression protein